MSESIHHLSADPNLFRSAVKQRMAAFLIVTAGLFSVLLVGWSWCIKGYQSQAEIVVQPVGEELNRQDFQLTVANLIRSHVTDHVLEDLIHRTRTTMSIQSPVLKGDLEKLRKAILVKTYVDRDPIRVQFTLCGQGTSDELIFLRDFTSGMAEALVDRSTNTAPFVVQNTELAKYQQILNELESSVGQLENRLVEVTELCGQSLNSSGQGPFRVASHRKDSKELADDIQIIQGKIRDIDLDYLRKSTAELKTLVNSLSTSDQPYALPIAKPVGTPQPRHLLVLLVLALAFGIVVATHYRPFASKGFVDLADVSAKLKIPVVAAFPINQRQANGSGLPVTEGRKLPWANRLVQYSSAWLLAVVVLVAGFCCVSDEVRQAFFLNPVDGLARAFWYFKR